MPLFTPPTLLRTAEVVTWIVVDHPKLDVVGLVLGAFSAAGFFIVSALALGIVFGISLILRRRHETNLHPNLDLLDRQP
jgi:hypothetical protein